MALSDIASGRHRNRKSEDILRYVERYFLQVAEKLRARQVGRSAADIPIRVAAVDPTTLQDTLQNPEFREGVVYSVIELKNLHESGCVMLQYGLIARLEAKSLGEFGEMYEPQVQARTLPPCTRKFVHRLLSELCSDLQEHLPGTSNFSLSFSTPSVTEPSWDAQQRGNDVFAAMIDIGPLAQPYGLLSVVLPVRLFETVFGLKASKNSSEPENGMPDNQRILGLPVDVIAELDRFSMSYAAVRDMMIGDFIPLNEQLQVKIQVNQQTKFLGEFGEVSGFRAVRIDDAVTDVD